jgi:hypothetical protein
MSLSPSMEEIVHVVPLGWELDRAVLPFSRYSAHRVYLLCDPGGHAKRAFYLEKVSAKLRKKGIEVRLVEVDTFMDLPGTMREVSRIVQTELNAGARVHVNISAAGRMAAIGAALAAMAHLRPGRGSVYYVPAVDYPTSVSEQRRHGMSRGMRGDPLDLPLFELTLPSLPARLILSALLNSSTKRLKYGDARSLLARSGFEGFGTADPGKPSRKARTAWSVNLHRKVVQTLVRQRLVQVESLGRDKTLTLTREGEYVACLSLLIPESSALRTL